MFVSMVTCHWMLDTRYWLLVAGYWSLASGPWLLDAIAHSVQVDNSEISETSNAMPSAPCALPLKSEIPNPNSKTSVF